jgi:hypothetical protein
VLKRLEADEGARANGQHSVEIIGLGVHASSVRARNLSERLGYESIQTLHGLMHGVAPDCQSKESKSEEPHPCGEVLFPLAKFAIARRHLLDESTLVRYCRKMQPAGPTGVVSADYIKVSSILVNSQVREGSTTRAWHRVGSRLWPRTAG